MSKFQLGEPETHKYDGVNFTEHFVPEVIDRIRKYVFDPSDIFVASFPKTGTTWTTTLVSLILSNGEAIDTPFAFLEWKSTRGPEPVFDMEIAKPPPRYFMTHLPFRFLEEGLKKSRPKVIYVMRNPFDQMVSFYHFCKMNEMLGLYTGSWDEFYNDLYKKGKFCYGDYPAQVLGWWNARKDHADHILYLKYEDMLRNPRDALEKIASFLGKTLSDDVIRKILDLSSFQSMKANSKVNKDNARYLRNDIVSFMRKGTAGDWKNFFSQSQTDEVMKIYKEKLVSCGLEFDLGIPSEYS